jgi:hypothetical protein
LKKLFLIAGLASFSLFAMALAAPMSKIGSFQESIADSATLIDPDDGYGYSSVRCFNLTTTPVYLGGSNVNTSTLGYPICTDTAACPESAITVDGQNVYGIVATGSTTVTCIKGK